MENVLRVLCGGVIAGGIVIGVICAPFMFSADIVDVTGAGLGCVTGSVLITGGLRSLVVLHKSSDVATRV
jgi:hypothetical protein